MFRAIFIRALYTAIGFALASLLFNHATAHTRVTRTVTHDRIEANAAGQMTAREEWYDAYESTPYHYEHWTIGDLLGDGDTTPAEVSDLHLGDKP